MELWICEGAELVAQLITDPQKQRLLESSEDHSEEEFTWPPEPDPIIVVPKVRPMIYLGGSTFCGGDSDETSQSIKLD